MLAKLLVLTQLESPARDSPCELEASSKLPSINLARFTSRVGIPGWAQRAQQAAAQPWVAG